METNAIYCGDCADVMNAFPEESVDLIYVDPPFFTAKNYEVIWKDGAEIRAYEDRWKGGIENFISWIEPKLTQCYRILKKRGSIYLHCDWHANAHLRILMDRIFGDRLVNEIIWKRTSAHTGEGTVWSFGTVHDTILFYTKSDDYIFNPQYVPLDEARRIRERR